MTNMSYCMFENTQIDIRQLIYAFQDGEVDPSDMSEHESRAFYSIASQARELADLVDEYQPDCCKEDEDD